MTSVRTPQSYMHTYNRKEIAPSLDALQEMIDICETYANSHNLRFSKDQQGNVKQNA